MTRRLRRSALFAVVPVLAVAAAAYGLERGERDSEPSAQASAAKSYKGFGAHRWPPAGWRPYSRSSPFNRPIPNGTRAHPRSDEMVRQILSSGVPAPMVVGTAGTSYDYGHPTYYAKSTDPVYRLRPTAGWGRNAIAGRRIRIPSEARPAAGSDGHMTVVTPDGWEYDLWQVHDKPAGGGTLSFSWGGRIRIDGDGLGDGGTASGFGNLAGMIRAQELKAGRINHALFVVLRCTSGDTSFGHGVRRGSNGSYVYPANDGDAACAAGTPAPPMGARLQLAMSRRQIDALRAPAWQKTILRALARYGGYVGDTGGPGFALMFESSAMYASFGQPDPLVAMARSAGLREHDGMYAFDVGEGVDWARHLRVVPPPKRR